MKLIRPLLPHVIFVTLSERNLRTLLYKLTVPGSERTIVTTTEGGKTLYVKAECDSDHYLDHEPGPMSDDTEEFLKKGVK